VKPEHVTFKVTDTTMALVKMLPIARDTTDPDEMALLEALDKKEKEE